MMVNRLAFGSPEALDVRRADIKAGLVFTGVSRVDWLKSEIFRVERALEDSHNEIEAARAEIKQAEGVIEDCESDIFYAEKDIADYETQIETLRLELERTTRSDALVAGGNHA
jgi:chromosome segregation ATPase